MAEPYIAQITLFGGNFPPRGWAFCDGQLLQISSNPSLFSILGTTYGGDGRTSFGLPDLRGRVSIHPGNGPGLPNYSWGQRGGSNQLTLAQLPPIPPHSHQFAVPCNGGGPDETSPVGSFPANSAAVGEIYNTASNAVMGPGTTAETALGGSSSNHFLPYLGVHYIIALVGVFPSRN